MITIILENYRGAIAAGRRIQNFAGYRHWLKLTKAGLFFLGGALKSILDKNTKQLSL